MKYPLFALALTFALGGFSFAEAQLSYDIIGHSPDAPAAYTRLDLTGSAGFGSNFSVQTDGNGVPYWRNDMGGITDFVFYDQSGTCAGCASVSQNIPLPSDGFLYMFMEGYTSDNYLRSSSPSQYTSQGTVLATFSVDTKTIKLVRWNGFTQSQVQGIFVGQTHMTSGGRVYGVFYTASDLSAVDTEAEMYALIGASAAPTPVIIDWSAYSSPLIFSSTTSGIATNSPLWAAYTATDTLLMMQGSCSQAGNFFGEALCVAGSYLFTPNPNILSSWAALPATAETKFPFSWVVAVKASLTGLSASSTQNFPVSSFALHDLGYGSTTPIGNFLPNFTAFASTTVLQYMPAGVWAAGQALIAAALWLALGFDIYATVRRRHAHV